MARLGRLERATAREVAIYEKRVAAVKRDLDAAQAILDSTVVRRNRAQARALRLRARLAQSRGKLAALLRERYAGGRPDMLTVVLEADGFASLLETVDFLKRIQRSDEKILTAVRSGRRDAIVQRRVLTRLEVQRRTAAEVVRRRHAALSAIADGLRQRRDALSQARSARLAALSGSRRSGRRRAERQLDKLLAERNRSIGQVGPGGPWAIPWVVVQCESGGPEPAAELGDRVGLLPVHHRRRGRASAARRRTPTRHRRPSRTASRRGCGTAGAARATGTAPRSSASSEVRADLRALAPCVGQYSTA